MNTPNPLVPQGSLLEEKAKAKTSLPVAFFIFLALHAVVLGGILMVGCKKEEQNPTAKSTLPPLTNDLPPLETNALYTPPPAATNPPVAQAPVTPPTYTNPATAIVPDPSTSVPQQPIAGAGVGGGAGGLGGPGSGQGQGIADGGGASAGGTEYKVAKGDTFATIAKKHGTTIQKIAKANPGVNSSRLKVGQTLVIPGGSASAPAASGGASTGAGAVASGGSSDSGEVYVVKTGDNLTKIAKSHGTTLKAIRAANNMKTDRIVVGQKLKMPAGKSAGAAAAPAEPAAAAPAPAPAPSAVAPLPPAGAPVTPRS